jgi:hypothetical protein
MAAIHYEEILKKMLDAAKGSLGKHLPETLSYMEEELKTLLDEVKQVELRKATGEIDADVAAIQLDTLFNAAKTVKKTGEGIVKVEAEKAINAAIKVLTDALAAVV